MTWAIVLIGDKVWSDVVPYDEAVEDAIDLASKGHKARVYKLTETHYYEAVPPKDEP